MHEVIEDGNLRELYKASGGAWGGTTVDKAYEDMLITIFGDKVFKKFKDESIEDYIDIFRTFEVKKRGISATTEIDTVISLPATLVEVYNEETEGTVKTAVSKSGLAGMVTPEKGNKLRIKPALMKKMFTTAVEKTVDHVSKLLQVKSVSGAKTILMVGGLSESKILYDNIKSSFPKLNVVVPVEPALSVLKGAVMFGYNPAVITERILNYTYGIDVRELFEDGIDPIDKLVVDHKGKRRCDNRFDKFAECDQVIIGNQEIKLSRTFFPSATTNANFLLYASTLKTPRYVTDKDCFHVGTLHVDFENDDVKNLEKEFRVCGYFGEPEIRIIAEDVNTGERFSATFELPDK